MGKISVEKCLNKVPNKFELSILSMYRAKEILSGSKSEIEDDKLAMKPINKSLREIEEDKVDIDSLEKKVKSGVLTNDLFLKDSNRDEDREVEYDDMNVYIDDSEDSSEDSLEDDIDDEYDNFDCDVIDDK